MRQSAWSAYRPSDACPWNLERAWTLRRRAGFAATRAELEHDLVEGPEPAIDRVLAGECRSEGVPADFESTATLLGESAAGSSDPRRLQAWWLYRMLFTPDPLLERLTLMWHDHFATSQLKVEDTVAMRAQNETFRRLARGPFGDLLRAMLRDPALLVWLDAPSNRKGKPNENFARELLELFTLGVGRYEEKDIRETARTLTGRTVARGQFQSRDDYRDDGEKTIIGKTSRFEDDALADHLLAQPAAADRLAWRLCAAFLGEGVADDAARGALAHQLHRDGLHVGRAVAMILRSDLFFSARNLRDRVSDPLGFAVGAARALEQFEPPPSTLLLAEWTARMGQELFFPPNVGGWPAGRSWLTGRAVVARANFSAALTAGELDVEVRPIDLDRLASRHGRRQGMSATIAWFGELLTGRPANPAVADALWKASKRPSASAVPRLNTAVALLLARPEAQLT
jgi:uncharacterized protein (DUF1800 family)